MRKQGGLTPEPKLSIYTDAEAEHWLEGFQRTNSGEGERAICGWEGRLKSAAESLSRAKGTDDLDRAPLLVGPPPQPPGPGLRHGMPGQD